MEPTARRDENIAMPDLIRFYFSLRPPPSWRGRAPAYDMARIESAPNDPANGRAPSKSESERETGIATVVRASNNERKTGRQDAD